MGRLGHHDFAQVAEFLRELYAQTDAARFPDTLLAGLARLISCENLGYNDINSKTNEVTMVVQPFVPRILELAPVLESHFHEHPQLAYYRRTRDRGAYQFTDFLSARQFRQTGIYREFYRHISAEHQMTLVLSEQNEANDIGIAINRQRRGFCERDRVLLNILRPHLVQARANALAFTAGEQRKQALEDSLASFHASVVLLHPDGRVAWLAPRALAMLARFFPDTARSIRQLPAPLARWWRLRQASARSSDALARTQAPCTVTMPGSRLRVYCQAGPEGTYRLLLTEETDFALAPRARQSGLTPREAEVLHWLAEGKSNLEIAIILQISPRTVHKHVEHVLNKLGVESRHAATLKVWEWKRGR